MNNQSCRAGGLVDLAHGAAAIGPTHRREFERREWPAAILPGARAGTDIPAEALARIVHELRTPLNAVAGFADAALHETHGPLEPGYRDYFARILAAGRHLETLVEDLLDLARADAGRLTLTSVAVPVRPLLLEATAMVTPLAAQGDVAIAELAQPLEWQLRADPTRTRQILVNLLANAVKFTPPGGHVGIIVAAAGEGSLDLTVWDTGIGIPDEERERIFIAFERCAGRPPQGNSKGLGLGLAISRQLARAMAGEIRVESGVGSGSRFILRLPLAEA
jgi:signal transduction histidine kinase